VNRTDREIWQSARTLGDLGELTARWIEGDLRSQPGYYGPTDIEDPVMAPVLAALCRAGYMTTQSQAGVSGPGYDGECWRQCAAVEGLASEGTARRIAAVAEWNGLIVVLNEPPRRFSMRYGCETAVTVTWRAAEPVTSFGARLPRTHLRSDVTGYGECHRDAVNAVCVAWQVTVMDPKPGRPDLLWDTLTRALLVGAS
jgi:hypothetical protein